ncbi:MAG TPA: hypothetical protein DCE24_05400 [Porphyromonadaceae bacterium]|nr:hypothetical protein [Porphyromonadaceae bacterium]
MNAVTTTAGITATDICAIALTFRIAATDICASTFTTIHYIIYKVNKTSRKQWICFKTDFKFLQKHAVVQIVI